MSRSWLLLNCLFVTAVSAQILPPQNLSLRWIDDFTPELSWAPPQHSLTHCSYEVIKETNDKEDFMIHQSAGSPFSDYTIMEGGFLKFSISTNCNESVSEKVVLNQTHPDLVKNLKCYVYSHNKTSCSWSPIFHSPEPRFFYRLQCESTTSSCNSLQELQECSSYSYNNSVKTGCSLQASSVHSLIILFNVTLKSETLRNTFRIDLANYVRLPALRWTVDNIGDKFNISWTPPELLPLADWAFLINYTKCNESKSLTKNGVTLHELPRSPHCHSCLAIKAQLQGIESIRGETAWTDKKCFDADSSVLVYVAVIVPLVIIGLIVLALMWCYQKHKDKIFPKVPEPRDLLSDICENNNKVKTIVYNLYAPAEEENCKIALVIDPQNSK